MKGSRRIFESYFCTYYATKLVFLSRARAKKNYYTDTNILERMEQKPIELGTKQDYSYSLFNIPLLFYFYLVYSFLFFSDLAKLARILKSRPECCPNHKISYLT